MVIIAASAGAAIYFYFGVSVSEAATVAVATLTALAPYNTLSNRIGVGIGRGRARWREPGVGPDRRRAQRNAPMRRRSQARPSAAPDWRSSPAVLSAAAEDRRQRKETG
jgi:hypothetical protein